MSNWFKNKFTWIPMIIAIFVGLTFVFSLIPGFSKMPDGIKNMRVAVVNQDNNQISTTVARKLKQNLPFEITDVDNSVTKAKSQVRKDNLSVVVVIPKGFAQKAESNQKPQLNYIENSSVGTLESNTGTSVATRVNTMVQQQLQSKALIGILACWQSKWQQRPIILMRQRLPIVLRQRLNRHRSPNRRLQTPIN